MLFNSYIFIGAFLPLTLSVYALLQSRGKFDIGWLGLMSLVFYAWWNWHYIPLLCGSIAFNFVAGQLISRMQRDRQNLQARRIVLTVAIIANICLLGYFKYANFFLSTVAMLDGATFQPLAIILPLGISFFTFTQIAFLVDAFRGEASEYDFSNYVLFVSYFPHLIAGPILHHKQIMPQFANREGRAVTADTLALGLTIFIIGLFKKVVFADNIAPFADKLFGATDVQVSMLEAWGGMLAYTLQIYFDFSGYCDMAIGISRMFGINLPINFNSPYQARSIIEFWRRWHMTLSQFLRDYVYIPLGGNRKGPRRRYLNLLATMLVGGLWHGAGWTFVVWGALHGIMLAVNHLWRAVRERFGGIARGGRWWTDLIAWAMTFALVNVAWVFFRSNSIESAIAVFKGLTGLNGIIPARWIAGSPAAAAVAAANGVPQAIDPATVQLGGRGVVLIVVLLVIALFMPNTLQITRYVELVSSKREEWWPRWLAWQPSALWAIGCGGLGAACIYMLGNSSRFLYFQF